jgi:hypothetical protein
METTTWPQIAEGLYSFLTGRGSTTSEPGERLG